MAYSSKKDFAWQLTKDLDPVTKHFSCVFCNHKCTSSISRFKHHLGDVSSGGMISCKKVPPNVKEECFANVMGTKEKRKASHELCRGGGEESENVDMGTTRTPYVSSESGSGSGSVSVTHSQQTGSFLPPRSRKPLDSAIPFNVENNDHYVNAMKLVSNFDPGFNAPTSHEYRTLMLKEAVEDVQTMMKEHQKAWKRYGCTIMSEGWSNGKSRCLINFLVNSPQGTWFLKSIDASASIKNRDLLYGYLDDVIQEVGEENVVQKVWWTPCAAHCIDLMLEDISKMAWFDDTFKRARCISKQYTNNSEILRPAVTRFATSFLTLQSLQKQKENLVALFASQEWLESTYAKSREAKLAKHHGVLPLVCVLREVDSEERPPIGFIYELIDAAKEKIASNLNKVEKKYMPIWRKIDPIDEVVNGLFACMDMMLGKGKEREEANCQLDLYNDKRGPFVDSMAMQTGKKRTPTAWWERFGHKTLELRKFDVQVLSLTCSALGCERNWSTFSMIHTKRRNKLEHKRLNALAYVKYNLALQQRSKKMREKYDPIVVEEITSDDKWITEIENPVLPEDHTWLEDKLLYNVEAVKNVPPSVYEGGPYIREPRESSPPPPCEPTQPRGPITYKRKRGNEESSNRRNESYDEFMTYPTRSSRVGNEEDDALYLDEEDLDD
ncbi:unnamed protein product [Malus baccata var. baccata]